MSTAPNSSLRRNLLLELSPWVLAVACTLLLLLLALFARSNYQREKDLIEEALVEKGLTLVRFINSATRESLRDELRFGREWAGWENLLQTVIDQAVEQPGVEAVLLVDRQGGVLLRAGDAAPLQEAENAAADLVNRLEQPDSPPFHFSIDQSGEGGRQTFRLVIRQGLSELTGRPERGRMPMMMSRHFTDRTRLAVIEAAMAELAALRPVYLLQLDFTLYTSPLQRQFLQIVILLLVLALVGVGGGLSLLTLRGLKGSQIRLGEIRAFTDLVVSSLPLGLVAADGQGMIRLCNDAARTILGLSAEEVAGRAVADSLPPEPARMLAAGGDGRVEQRETRLSTALGETRTVQLTSLAVHDGLGGDPGTILLIRDLTEVRRLEKELQRSERMAALGKMAAGVAHELRNPLSSIKGLALLLRGHFTAGSREAGTADLLVGEVERLNRSIGELLEYARPAQLQRQEVVVNALVEETLALIAADARLSGVVVTFLPAPDLPGIDLDPDRIKQVLLNLLLNALQAMPSGGALRVATVSVDGTLEIRIEDSGVGIPAENLGRVFDPYYTTKNDGTGLGLALSVKIVEEHGGTITIGSRPGESTAVCISLPLCGRPSSDHCAPAPETI